MNVRQESRLFTTELNRRIDLSLKLALQSDPDRGLEIAELTTYRCVIPSRSEGIGFFG